ncbi:hypothetical protein NUKP64_46500 [Klebsiella variicola]|nr:hypothetical protein NUKP64_46500 [Klebsiella variicola]
MLGELAIGFDFNVRSWHRADKLTDLKVRYERKTEVRNRVGTGIISIGVFYQRGALHPVRPTGLAGIHFKSPGQS